VRGSGVYSAEALKRKLVYLQKKENMWLARHKKLCWACQKEKSPNAGKLTRAPGITKFVCFDCLSKKGEKNEG
jgi:hypothetical protein